jgi:hypothetical protein
VLGDPKTVQLLEEIRRNSEAGREHLEAIRTQLTWMSLLLLPILLANAAAAVKLFLLG